MRKHHPGKVDDDATLEDFDFSPFRKKLDRIRKALNKRPIEERVKESREKSFDERKHLYCIFDGKLERI